MSHIRWLLLLLLLLVSGPLGAAELSGSDFNYAGMPLTEVLEELRDQGLRLLYGSNTVRPTMTVESKPEAESPRLVLEEILAPHGLTVRESESGILTVVVAPRGSIFGRVLHAETGAAIDGAEVELLEHHTVRSDLAGRYRFEKVPAGTQKIEVRLAGYAVAQSQIELLPGDEIELDLVLESVSNTLEEIIVTPGQVSILHAEPSAEVLWTREEVNRLPHLSDDLFRAVSRLPGITRGDFSADFHARGGESNELLVLIDGLRVYEPYHLKDFENVFSVFDTNAVDSVQVMKGGFTSEYGDRMSSVIDISSVVPQQQQTMIGVSFEKAYVVSQGIFAQSRADWLVSARQGYLDLILDLSRQEGDDFDLRPNYWDLFGKVRTQIGQSGLLAFHTLAARDTLDFSSDVDDDDVTSSHQSSYVWATYDSLVSRQLSQSSVISYGQLKSRRNGESGANVSDPIPDTELDQTIVSDRRNADIVQFGQNWNLDVSDRNLFKFGLDLRWLEASYDYSLMNIVTDPVFTDIPIFTERQLGPQPEGWTFGLYLADRFRVGKRVTLEAGVRWDRQTYVDDDQLSPRLNLVAQLSPSIDLRASVGQYYQAQGIHELQVEDGVDEFFPAQLNRQATLALDRRLGPYSQLSVQLYYKSLVDPRPRFENLYEPIDIFPEGQSDRVLVVPDKGEAQGLELFFERRKGRLDWWIGYTLSEVTDEIDGEDVPRSWDERHALTYSFNLLVGKYWNLNLAGIHHSGWPATDIAVITDPGDPFLRMTPTPRNSTEYPDYHRIDFRTSRVFPLARGEIKLYFEITNLLNRDNIRSVSEFSLEPQPGGAGVRREFESWFPRLPSFGVSWMF